MKHTPQAVRFACALACTLIAAATLAPAGPLNPPAGAIASSGKTLTEIEPRTVINATNTPGDALSLYKITQPGSYYLTGNLVGVAGKHGIRVLASGVTIDFNGFHVVGAGGSGTYDGVEVSSSNDQNISVLNGTVRNWSGCGLNLALNNRGGRIEGVHAIDNGEHGISSGANVAVINCSAVGNNSYGFRFSQHCTVRNCSASGNTGGGFSAFHATTLIGCTAGDNSGPGFDVDGACVLTNCAAKSNSDYGFLLADNCCITDCTAWSNSLDNINCGDTCTIRGNTLTEAGGFNGTGAGIRTSGTHNRIEGNNCTGGSFGVYVTGTGNVITRNTCSDNTQNFVISAGNVHGPVVDRTAPGGATIVGNSGAGTMGTTDTNANFAY